MKTPAIILAKVSVTGFLFWYLTTKIDFSESFNRILSISPGAVILVVSLIIAGLAIVSLRWKTIMSKIGIDLETLTFFKTYLVANFFNVTLLSSLTGDAFRMWKLSRITKPLIKIFNGIVLDRLMGMLGLIIIIAFGISTLPTEEIEQWTKRSLFALLIILIIAYLILARIKSLPKSLEKWRIVKFLKKISTDTVALVKDYRCFSLMILYSIAIHVISIFVLYILAISLGITIDFLTSFALFAIVIFSMLIPISIAGWGVREGVMVVLLGLIGISSESALALSILYGIILTIVGLMGGIFWLFERK
jgi:uncharacterized protein (TIRG00374 family)|tara:strand:- start:2300 stop:3217 length:918 start_codon:yes stop_codon:yes gene_type:complete